MKSRLVAPLISFRGIPGFREQPIALIHLCLLAKGRISIGKRRLLRRSPPIRLGNGKSGPASGQLARTDPLSTSDSAIVCYSRRTSPRSGERWPALFFIFPKTMRSISRCSFSEIAKELMEIEHLDTRATIIVVPFALWFLYRRGLLFKLRDVCLKDI